MIMHLSFDKKMLIFTIRVNPIDEAFSLNNAIIDLRNNSKSISNYRKVMKELGTALIIESANTEFEGEPDQ